MKRWIALSIALSIAALVWNTATMRRMDRAVVPPAYAVPPADRKTGLQISPQTTSPIASNAAGIWNHSGVPQWQNSGPTQSLLLDGSPTATGDTPYSTAGSGAMSFNADVAVGSYYRSGGIGAAPVWSTLTVPNACTTGDIFYCSGTNAEGNLIDVATGSVLASGGVGVAPSWVGLPLLTAPNGSTAQGHGLITIYADALTTGSSTSVTVTTSAPLPAHTLGANSQRLRVFAAYAHASGTSNNCQNNVGFFNGVSTTTTGSISGAVASEAYSVEVVYTRISSSTIQWNSHAHANASVADSGGTITGLNLDTTAYSISDNMLATTATADCTFAGFAIDLLSN